MTRLASRPSSLVRVAVVEFIERRVGDAPLVEKQVQELLDRDQEFFAQFIQFTRRVRGPTP